MDPFSVVAKESALPTLAGKHLTERYDLPTLATIGAILAALAVSFGAFGTHILKPQLDAEAIGWWHTAVQYQFWHALAVLSLGLANLPWARLPALMLAVGALLFSGTLYAMALGAPRWFGAITPFGGVAMIIGWCVLAWRASSAKRL